MSRSKYTNKDLGAFSDWHRERLLNCHRFIDIDYLGYQIVYGEYMPYVAIERIRLKNIDPGDGVDRYPLEGHKKKVYQAIAEGLDIPAYVMWHTDDCRVFVVKRIDRQEGVRTLEGASELMDFLDGLCRDQFGELSYR